MSLLEYPYRPGAADDRDAELKMTFDGVRYTYRGISFTREEAGVLPACPQDRLCAMVDATLANSTRQAEICRFGRRVWHSVIRPEPAVEQALDYIFEHDVLLVSRVLPFLHGLFKADPQPIDDLDVWVTETRIAYVHRFEKKQDLYRLLLMADIPSQVIYAL